VTFLNEQPLLVLRGFLASSLSVSLLMPAGRTEAIRVFITSASRIACVFGRYARTIFDKSAGGFQFAGGLDIFEEYNLNFTFGVDGLSLSLVRLTLFIFPVCFLAA